jgi:hypothetical protein
VEDLVGNGIRLFFGDTGDSSKVLGVTGYQCTFAQEVLDILEIILLGELINVAKHLLLSHVAERILNPSCSYKHGHRYQVGMLVATYLADMLLLRWAVPFSSETLHCVSKIHVVYSGSLHIALLDVTLVLVNLVVSHGSRVWTRKLERRGASCIIYACQHDYLPTYLPTTNGRGDPHSMVG